MSALPAGSNQAKTDRRSSRTRTAVRTAFNSLLLSKGYAEMTMGEVAQLANVGRSTLYEHFRTKDEVLRMSLKGPFAPLAALVVKDAKASSVILQLEHFRAQRTLARVLFAAPTRSLLTDCLSQLIEAQLDQVYQGRAILPIDLIAVSIASTQLALLEHWLQRRVSLAEPLLADALLGSTHALIEASRNHSCVDAGIERRVG